ncbi:MAG: MFS transporter [Asgard group archaeon]|nr:MFS transporter [Asgard group archaeon]
MLKSVTEMTEETVEMDSQETSDEKRQSNGYRFRLFSIAGISNAAIFVARTFLGLFAVFLEASTTALSLITSLRNLIQQAFQSTFGRISDNIGRKIMMFVGLLGCGITLALFPLIQNEWVLVGAVVAFSIGFASFYPSFTALQGDLTTKRNRAGLISLITIIGGGVTLVYLIIVGFLGDLGETNPKQFLIIFEITASLFVICAVVSLFLYEPKVKRITEQRIFSLKPMKENKTFRRFVIANSVVAFCMSIGWPIFPYVRGTFATNRENSWVWAFFCLFQVIILLAINPLINRVKKTTLLFIGRVGMFYVPINLAITIYWLPYWWHLAIAGALGGLCNALYWVGQNSYILDCAPEEEKGTYTGIHNLFIGLSTFLGSLIMGLIADNIVIKNEWFTIYVLLMIIAAGRFLSSLGFLFIGEPEGPKTADPIK